MSTHSSDTWTHDHDFGSSEQSPVRCDKASCRFGVYSIETDGVTTMFAPACPAFNFFAALDEVFNPDEPKHAAGAPECFKQAAARALQERGDLKIIRRHRPLTYEIILSYLEASVDSPAR